MIIATSDLRQNVCFFIAIKMRYNMARIATPLEVQKKGGDPVPLQKWNEMYASNL